MYKNTLLLLLLMPKKTITLNRQFSIYACGKQADMAVRDAVKYEQMHKKVCDICKNRAEPEKQVCKLEKHTGKKMFATFVIE